jgi:hypothetical protein
MRLHQSLHVRLVVFPPRYAKLLRSLKVCLMEAFRVGCRYPDNGAVGVLIFYSKEQLEHKLSLTYAAKSCDGNLGSMGFGKQHSF